MLDQTAFESQHRPLTGQQLLQLRSEGGFTAEAERAFSIELAQCHLGSNDVNKYVAAAERSKLRDEIVERGGYLPQRGRAISKEGPLNGPLGPPGYDRIKD